MWQDLAQRRETEVDALNGEIVRLAAATGQSAALNQRLLELVHAAERSGQGRPPRARPRPGDRGDRVRAARIHAYRAIPMALASNKSTWWQSLHVSWS